MDRSPRVLITGMAGGIGGAAAARLRARGARVLGLDLEGADDILACDVTDQVAVEAAVAEAVERLSGLDALVNAAGIGSPTTASEPPDEEARRIVEVNLWGTWRVTAAALTALRESRGRVINVASGLAHIAFPFATAYGISKRGVVAYSDQLRAELGDLVTVTTVYPGYIRTPIHDASEEAGLSLAGVAREEPLSAAAETLERAVFGPPRRDLATTRRGTVEYALLRLLPRRLVDRIARDRVRASARKGHYDDAPIATDLAERMRA